MKRRPVLSLTSLSPTVLGVVLVLSGCAPSWSSGSTELLPETTATTTTTVAVPTTTTTTVAGPQLGDGSSSAAATAIPVITGDAVLPVPVEPLPVEPVPVEPAPVEPAPAGSDAPASPTIASTHDPAERISSRAPLAERVILARGHADLMELTVDAGSLRLSVKDDSSGTGAVFRSPADVQVRTP